MPNKVKITEWSIFDCLDSEKAITAYLQVVAEEKDSNAMLMALGTVAKAKGINKMAEELDIDRELLYKNPYEETKPELRIITQAVDKLGLEINFKTNEG